MSTWYETNRFNPRKFRDNELAASEYKKHLGKKYILIPESIESTYQFKCVNPQCDHEFKLHRSETNDELFECPECRELYIQDYEELIAENYDKRVVGW